MWFHLWKARMKSKTRYALTRYVTSLVLCCTEEVVELNAYLRLAADKEADRRMWCCLRAVAHQIFRWVCMHVCDSRTSSGRLLIGRKTLRILARRDELIFSWKGMQALSHTLAWSSQFEWAGVRAVSVWWSKATAVERQAVAGNGNLMPKNNSAFGTSIPFHPSSAGT